MWDRCYIQSKGGTDAIYKAKDLLMLGGEDDESVVKRKNALCDPKCSSCADEKTYGSCADERTAPNLPLLSFGCMNPKQNRRTPTRTSLLHGHDQISED